MLSDPGSIVLIVCVVAMSCIVASFLLEPQFSEPCNGPGD